VRFSRRSPGEIGKRWWAWLGSVPEISVEQLKQWLDEGRPVQLIDARTGLEFQSGTIGGAQHAPVTEMPVAVDRLAIDPDRPVVALCLSGHRSRPAVRLLRSRGVEAYSLKGGLLRWRLAGFALQPPER